jgi:death-on-curing protein
MKYLTAKEIIEINAYLIKRYSPKEEIEVKQPESFDMAVAQPRQSFQEEELYPTIHEKAAILLINLVKKHIFANGNKRTAFVSVARFYAMNGYKLKVTKEIGDHLTVGVAISESDFEEMKSSVVEILTKYAEKQAR